MAFDSPCTRTYPGYLTLFTLPTSAPASAGHRSTGLKRRDPSRTDSPGSGLKGSIRLASSRKVSWLSAASRRRRASPSSAGRGEVAPLPEALDLLAAGLGELSNRTDVVCQRLEAATDLLELGGCVGRGGFATGMRVGRHRLQLLDGLLQSANPLVRVAQQIAELLGEHPGRGASAAEPLA